MLPPRVATRQARRSAWVFAAAAFLGLATAGCAPASGVMLVNDMQYQWGEQIDEARWKPVPSITSLPETSSSTLWMRIRAPAVEAADPALSISRGLDPPDVWVDGREVEVNATRLMVPLPGPPATVLMRTHVTSRYVVPQFRVGSQRALWAVVLRRELPEAIIGGALTLAGLLLLTATLRPRAAKAQAGLGMFLTAVGVLALTQLRQLRHVFIASADGLLLVHEIATLAVPVGFALFARATFGEGAGRGITRGLRLYAAYLVVITVLVLAGVVSLAGTRAGCYPFILWFIGYALVRARGQAARGDRAARMFLWGIGIFLLVALPDLAEGAGHALVPMQTVPVGALAFGVAMAIVIENRISEAGDAVEASAEELKRKVVALEERNVEVQTLNRELRHQIAERSRQMRSAYERAVTGTAATVLRDGDVVGGRYRVIRPLGRGGMGVVYEVARESDRKHFALKVLSGEGASRAAARFAREAEIAASLAHEHLVAIVDVGTTSAGGLYLVMELVEGQALDEVGERRGDVPWAVAVLAQVAEGLAALHAAGVVHRDLKPGNVLISTRDGAPFAKISDFGVSRLDPASEDSDDDTTALATEAPDRQGGAMPIAADAAHAETVAASPLTETGVVVGTPGYLAPELAHGSRRARPASDVFAFGLIAYDLLTGRPAFDEPPIFTAFARRRLAPLAPFPASIDKRVSDAVTRCLAESPGDRPSASELAALLASVRG